MALKFINQQIVPHIESILLLPLKIPPERLASELRLASDERIVLRGFSVFSFPVWSSDFGVMLTINDGTRILERDVDDIVEWTTMRGTFFLMPEGYFERKLLITVRE